MLYLKVGALAGLLIATPFVMWQLWLFIAPGLYAHEKKFAIPFVALSTFFFAAGAAFSHYVAFPWTWKFFIDFKPDYVQFDDQARTGVFALRKDAARLRGHLPDADGGVLPRAYGRWSRPGS